VPHEASTEARLQAYRLMEALQGGSETSAAAELGELRQEAAAAGWSDVTLLADLGVVMRGVIHPAPDGAPDTRRELDRLVADAERIGAPALLAHVLGLRAITAAASADTEGVLTDASRGLALLDRDDLPPLDACTALVVCAGALNALALWELVDEIYDRAAALSPHCEEPLQAAAIAMNRILIRIEWATEMLELDAAEPAREQLGLALQAAASAHRLDRLPEDWTLAVVACRSALEFCLEPPLAAESSLAQMKLQQQMLRSAGDVEMLPLSEVLVALRLLQTGRPAEALAWIREETTESASSGAHSFRLWVRAKAVAASSAAPDPAVAAAFAYADLLATQRRQARRALLGAARSRIAGERLRVERDRLFRDVAQDALTGLGNRRTFDTWLERDRTTITPTAMLLIDLDSFKAINDEHGHSVGDEVLRQVGAAIAHHVRQRDLALRLGGDEFAVIIEAWPEDSTGVDSLAASAHERARSLQRAITMVVWADIAAGLTVSASVGVAVRALDAHDDGGPTVLYNEADRELYVAKRRRNLPPPV
jgi:diguanylate cyclase (GGDEF)-like protein